MVELFKGGAHRAVACRDEFDGPIERLGDLPQRGCPVPALLFVELFQIRWSVLIASAKDVSCRVRLLIGTPLEFLKMDGDGPRWIGAESSHTPSFYCAQIL